MEFVFGLIVGIVVGAGGYYAYDKFFNKAEVAIKTEVDKIKAKL